MYHEILLLGEAQLSLPPAFLIQQRKINSQWAIEFNDRKFAGAIYYPEPSDKKHITTVLSLLRDKLAIKHIVLDATQIPNDLILDLLRKYPGLKFFDKTYSFDFKKLLPDSLQLTKFQLQEVYQQSLSSLHRAASISSIEQGLKQCLEEALDIETVRLAFSPHAERYIEQMAMAGKVFFALDNDFHPGQKAKIIFVRRKQQVFRKYEQQFLEKLSESCFLTMKRILRLEHLETLEQHWETTFNAFDAAIGVINKTGQLIKVNRTFEKYFGPNVKALKEIIIDMQWPPPKEEKKFSLADKTFDIHFHPYTQGWIFILRDVSEKEKLERQILESSKMAELGMIGSSIAHEINNPLGGMLSYLQLILMDLSKDQEHYQDIKEMEAATLKCKNIVENLLGFARKQDGGKQDRVYLDTVIDEAIELCQFPIKYKGTEIQKIIEIKNAYIKGNSNNLVQAVKNILQNSIEATEDHKGLITVKLREEKNKYQILIVDNGTGIPENILSKIYNPLFSSKKSQKHPGLGLTVAFQIIQDHGGSLEINSQAKGGTRAILSFVRPDL
ncbi:MAG: PAS domain-containing sensor histidine kinase [Bdellovibrionaceae bacterium]|nr:PAS domain-containing sensor histidine kinase [Pseudobdellovibrionaceae bacterium]